MADPNKVAKGALSIIRGASRAADEAMEAKRLAMEAANPPIKASEAYGKHEGAYLKPIFYDRMKVDLSKRKFGGPGFSSIQLVDPNYEQAKAVAGVTDQKMATRILNRNKANVPEGAKVIWTPSVGGLEQHKSNSTMFGQFADIFANQRNKMSPEEIQKLSDRASNAVNNKGELIFPNGIDLGSRNFRQKVNTYDQRALMADIFAGRGVGGEKGRTVPMEDLLEKNLDPNVANAGTLDLGNRLFQLEGNVIDRPDLHSDYRKILTGEDLGVNYIPVPIRDVYTDWEAQKKLDLAAQGKNRDVTLMDYTKNDPTVQLTEELLTKMQKAGKKAGGPIRRKETPEEMARFHERFALHKATGGTINIPALSLKKAKGGGVHMVDGGKMAKGLMGVVEKASKAADAAMAAPAVNRLDMNFKDVTKRVPELTEAANKLANGELSAAKYNAMVNKLKPVTPYSFVPAPATAEDAMRALTENKKPMFGKSKEMTAGEQADLRLDIPAYKDHGVWVNSIHRKDQPTVYDATSSVKNATMIGAPDKALKVAQGGPKAPFAVIRGDWNPMTQEEAVANAQAYLDHPEWKQIGYDPERHGYFYDRASMEPVHGAEEVIQIGPLVLAKKPTYGKKSEEKYAQGGLPRMAEGGESIDDSLKRMQNYSVLDKPKAATQQAQAASKKPNQLSGIILAGDSWLAGDEKTKLAKKAFGQDVTNTAIGGQKTGDVLNQLNVFERDGGTFAPGSTVVLDIGGNDIATGVNRDVTRNNLEELVSRLGDQGVKVILSAPPYANSYKEAIENPNLSVDTMYYDVAKDNPNVTVVDAMAGFLNQKDLMDGSGFHLKDDDSKLSFLNKLADAYKGTTSDNQETVDVPKQIEQVTQPKQQVQDTTQAVSQDPTDYTDYINSQVNAWNPVPGITTPTTPTVTSTPSTEEPEIQIPPPSAGYTYAQNNQGLDNYYQTITNYLDQNHTPEEIQAAMQQYGVSQADVDEANTRENRVGGDKRGGVVRKETPEEMERFRQRFVMHKATGGNVKIPHLSLKKIKKFDGGGIAAADVSTGIEDKGITKAGLMAEYLAKAAKEQGKEELESLKKPRAATDLLNRGVLANNPLSATVDMFNTGLGAVGLGSEKPFLGSEHVKDLMNKYGVTSGEERPLMETALSFFSPTAVIKSGVKATEAAKKAPELLKKATDTFTSSKLSPLATEAKTASAGKPIGATYVTKQEGPFFRVSPTTLDTSKAKSRGIREADELQSPTPFGGEARSSGSQVPTRLADEEVARIIADPAANEPLNIAKKYTQETQGADFVLPEMPESSLVKQSAIGRTHQLAVEGSPEYKTAIFDAYAQQMPEVLEQAKAKNYDDLMEKAYRQLAKETDDQFKALPYNFSYHRAGEGNYNSSKEMAADVHGNKHLYVFQGGDPHDFLNRIDPATGLNENEKFRAVHDLLGHAIYGNQFGPKGEETAWAIHSQMYSPLARLAMTAETRGQNSMVNYSPLNANLKAEIAKYDSLADEARRRGDKALLNEINAAKRQAYSGFQYAPQKAVLLPPEFLSTGYAGGMPSYLEAANRPVKGTETQSVLTHFSNDPNLTMLDPKRYGTGIKGAEGERLRDYPGAVRDRSYFYMGEPGTVSPEPGLGTNRYRGEASSLYDITQDPLNFQKLARESNRTPFTAKYNQGVTHPLQDANDIERLIKEYGYQGMANPKASKPMAIMFKETPVHRKARGGLTLMK